MAVTDIRYCCGFALNGICCLSQSFFIHGIEKCIRNLVAAFSVLENELQFGLSVNRQDADHLRSHIFRICGQLHAVHVKISTGICISDEICISDNAVTGTRVDEICIACLIRYSGHAVSRNRNKDILFNA